MDEREHLAALLIDESADGLIGLRTDGRVAFWNEGARLLYGYSADEILNRHLVDLLVPAHERHGVARAFQHALDAGRSDLAGVRLRKDGTAIEVSVAVRRRTLPGGDPILALRHRSMTGRAELEALRASETKFRSLLEAAPDAAVIVDAAGLIVIVNAQTERLFGYHRDELIGQPVEVLMPLRYRQAHRTHRGHYTAAPHPRAMGSGLELFGLHKDGAELPVEISLSPLETPEGTLISSAIRDISERRRLELRMQEASRQKSEFLANMSHELRTPLNAIVGFSELMYDGKVGALSEDHREYIGDILTSARHLLQLINDILDLAKVEAGKIEFQPADVDIAAVVEEVRDTLRGLASNKRLDVQVSVDPAVATVFVDPARLKQILYNYLSNAIKFTPEGGRIEVAVVPDGPAYFRIEVTDTGVGIASEHLSRLFVEFQQLDASAAKRYQGTGLGLALTKRLAEAQGGRVGVRSAPGEGSTFSATLPRSAAREDSGARADRPLLIVDDDPAARRLVRAALRDTGMPVVTAASAQEALRHAAANPPAAIVVDLLMPKPDGFAFIAALRATAFGQTVPVVVWTIKDLDATERRSLEAIVSAIVDKRPGGVDPLLAALERVLGTTLRKRSGDGG